MSFSHKAVYGCTGQGKSWLMKRLANRYKAHKQKILVYTGAGDFDGWPAGVPITTEPDQLEKWLIDPKNFRSFVFLDEITVLYEEAKQKKHPEIYGLFMRGRHRGYTAFGATQYPTAMIRRNRVNCRECYCFRLGDEESAKLVWRDYGQPEIDGRPVWEIILELQKLEFLHFEPDGGVKKMCL